MSCASCGVIPHAPRSYADRETADPTSESDDRDSRMMYYASRKGVGRERMLPQTPGGSPSRVWGGALRRMEVGGVTPSWEDEHRFISVPGRYVPVGFARYVPPLIDPSDYEYYRVAGWRVAVPRIIPGWRVRDLIYRIFYYGPQSAGYVRLGDTLVPAILDTGDRMTLSQTAVEYEPYPLSP
jgi:hypothetical protein